jgi:hypothetical protein
MSSERASLFGQDADMDLSDFKPKSLARPEQVRDVAEQAGFRSREGTKQAVESEALRREPRRYRTGRNVQLNLKVRQETVDTFYKLADEHGWVLGEAFEHAIDALRRELQKEVR